jgi:hypothetical protein
LLDGKHVEAALRFSFSLGGGLGRAVRFGARLASRERARGVRSIGKDGQQKKAGERLPPKQQQKSMRIHHNKGLCIAKGSEGVQGDLRRERFQGCGRLGGFFGGRFLGARGLDCCGFGAHRFEVRRLLSQPHARWRE